MRLGLGRRLCCCGEESSSSSSSSSSVSVGIPISCLGATYNAPSSVSFTLPVKTSGPVLDCCGFWPGTQSLSLHSTSVLNGVCYFVYREGFARTLPDCNELPEGPFRSQFSMAVIPGSLINFELQTRLIWPVRQDYSGFWNLNGHPYSTDLTGPVTLNGSVGNACSDQLLTITVFK